jgi:ABC-type phosphate transport system substrate-binding protein
LRRTAIIAVLSFALLTLAAVGSHSGASANASFVVIVHPEVKGDELPKVILSAIFLRKAPRWEDGLDVRPVDQSMSSPLRADFTAAVLEMPVNGLQRYWSDEIEKGVQPPPVKGSDEEVIAYVASTPGAIGYVSAGVALPEGVKAMDLVE